MTQYTVRLTETPIVEQVEADSYKIPSDEEGVLYFYNSSREVVAFFNSDKWMSVFVDAIPA